MRRPGLELPAIKYYYLHLLLCFQSSGDKPDSPAVPTKGKGSQGGRHPLSHRLRGRGGRGPPSAQAAKPEVWHVCALRVPPGPELVLQAGWLLSFVLYCTLHSKSPPR
jgi:hypothetical protein